MAVIGRTHRPKLDAVKCNTCGICVGQCPAYVDAGYRTTPESIREGVFGAFALSPPLELTPITASPPPCQETCPIGQDVRGYLKAVAEGRYADAVALIRETNPLPLVCGTICPHPCETACLRGSIEDPVGIRAVKRFAALYEREKGLKPVFGPISKKTKVAIIGAGPAGIAAAYRLAREGIQPVVFEKTPQPGGMLAWAIPEFRLPRDILDYEIGVLTALGIEFRTGQALGNDITLDSLKEEGFDAILLAIGTTVGKKVPLDGEADLANHLDCLTYLFDVHRGTPPSLGDRVAVIGGGNAAVDTARVLRRSGAREVTIVYRRTREQMPADREEVAEAEKEGVRFLFSSLPTRLGDRDGTTVLEGFETRSSGRETPVEVLKEKPFSFPVTGVISAISQVPDTSWADDLGLALNPEGTLQVDDSYETPIDGVYAAGDAVTGPTTVVEAMAGGMAAADAILEKFKRGKGE